MKAWIIGGGAMGREHLAAYQSAGAEVVGVTDPVTWREFGDIGHEMLFPLPGQADILSLAGPDSEHAKHLAHLDNFHIFTEKPPATRTTPSPLWDGWNGNERKHLLGCHYPLRFHDPFVALKNWAKGQKIYHIEAMYTYGREEKLKSGWRAHEKDYSIVHGGLIHLVDAILWITRQYFVEITAHASGLAYDVPAGKIPYTVAASGKLMNGCTVELTANFGPGQHHARRMVVYSTTGSHGVYDTKPTDKRRMILEFIQAVRGQGGYVVPKGDLVHGVHVCNAIMGATTDHRRHVSMYQYLPPKPERGLPE